MPAGRLRVCEPDGPLGVSDPRRAVGFLGRRALAEVSQRSSVLFGRKATKAATCPTPSARSVVGS